MDMKSTKCWSCANACTSGCSWSKDFTPVDGWNAVPVKYANGLESYEVIDCPEFVESGKYKAENLDDDGCMLLFEAVVNQAREDYVNGSGIAKEIMDDYLKRVEAARDKSKPKEPIPTSKIVRDTIEEFINDSYLMLEDPKNVISELREQAAKKLSKSERRERLMDMIKAHPEMGRTQIAKALNEEPKYVWYWMEKLKHEPKHDIQDLDGVGSVVFVED